MNVFSFDIVLDIESFDREMEILFVTFVRVSDVSDDPDTDRFERVRWDFVRKRDSLMRK